MSTSLQDEIALATAAAAAAQAHAASQNSSGNRDRPPPPSAHHSMIGAGGGGSDADGSGSNLPPPPPPPAPYGHEVQETSAQPDDMMQAGAQSGSSSRRKQGKRSYGHASFTEAAPSSAAGAKELPPSISDASLIMESQNHGQPQQDSMPGDISIDGVNKHLGPNRACSRCRERKLKCDGMRPVCSQCQKVKMTAERRQEKAGGQPGQGMLDVSFLDNLCVYADNPRRKSSVRKRKEPEEMDPETPDKSVSKRPTAKRGRKSNQARKDANPNPLQSLADAAHDVSSKGDGSEQYLGNTSAYGMQPAGSSANGDYGAPPPAPAPAAMGFGGGMSGSSSRRHHYSSGGSALPMYDSSASSAGHADAFLDMISDPSGGAGIAHPPAAPRPHANSGKAISAVLISMLPDLDKLYQDISFFFDNCAFMAISQPKRLLHRITMGPEAEEFPRPALLHAMLAWTYTMAPERAKSHEQRSLINATNAGFDQSFFAFGMAPGERHAAFCKQALWSNFGGWRNAGFKLDVCNAGIIFGQWLYASAHLPDAWIQVGINTRSCIPISLNRTRKPPPEDNDALFDGGGQPQSMEAGQMALPNAPGGGLMGPVGSTAGGYYVHQRDASQPGSAGNSRARTAPSEGYANANRTSTSAAAGATPGSMSVSSSSSSRRTVNLVTANFGVIPPKDWVEEEERRRTFWVALIGDRSSAATTSWANSLSEKDVHVELPASSQNEFAVGNANVPLHSTVDQHISDADLWEHNHVDGFRLNLKAGILLGRVGMLLSRLPSKPSEMEFRRILDTSIEREIAVYRESMQVFLNAAPSEAVFGERTFPLTMNALMIVECCSLMLYEPLVLLDPEAEARVDQICASAMGIFRRVSLEWTFRMPPVFSWCVGQLGRSLIRKIENQECHAKGPHEHTQEDLAMKRRLWDELKMCLDFLNHYGTRFELGNLQSRALARLLSCVAAHPGGDPTGICTAGEMSIYTLARSIDLSINGLAEQGGK